MLKGLHILNRVGGAAPGALAIAAIAGASAWVSVGTLAVTSDRLTRLGALPAIWWLPLLAAAAALAAWIGGLRLSESWPLVFTAVLWLPWLPVSVPVATFICEGPLEALIWSVAIAGVAVARATSWMRAVAAVVTDPRRAPVCIGALAVACALGAAVALADQHPGGDEPHYLIITQSLLQDGDLRIQNNHDRGDYLAYFSQGLSPDFLRRGIDGEIYSVHAPGLSVLIAPAFLAAGYPGAVGFVALVAAWGLACAWRAAYELTLDSHAAWMGALAAGASAPVVFHSFAIFPDPAGAAIVAAASLFLVRLHVAPQRLRSWHVAGMGVLLGILPWLHTRFTLLAGAFGLIFAVRLWRGSGGRQAVARFAAAPLMLAASWFAYFWLIYGTLNPAAPYGNSQQNAPAWIGRGLAGLAVDQQFGLFAAAPVMLLAAFGMLRLGRTRLTLALECSVVSLPYVLLVASFGMWWGGWSAPARFLVCLLPLSVPLLALAWQAAGRTGRSVCVALILIGAANVLARMFLLDGRLLYNFRDGHDVLLDWLSRTVNLPLGVPSVHRTGAWRAVQIALIWLSLAGIGVASLAVATRRVRATGTQWALTSLIGGLVVTTGLSLSWTYAGASPLTPESSEADFLRRWNPAGRPVVIKLPSMTRLPGASTLHEIELRTSVRARAADADSPLLAIPWVPAGRYQVTIEGAQSLAGVLMVSVGMTSPTIETWPLDGLTAGDTDLHLDLPAQVHSVVIRGDARARSRVVRLGLRPEALYSDSDAAPGYVVRSSRYGEVRAFLLDDQTYMEPGGLWTRGHATARLVLISDAADALVDLIAGPVDVAIAVRAGTWRLATTLTAGARQRIRVPTRRLLEVTSTGAFRPFDYEPVAQDRRSLGVRIEFPEP